MTRIPFADHRSPFDDSDFYDRPPRHANFPSLPRGPRSPRHPTGQLALEDLGAFGFESARPEAGHTGQAEALKPTKRTPVDELVPFYDIDFGM
jgi:hypothetical protein